MGKFKDFRARATEGSFGGFGARNNRGSLSAFSDEYFDHRRNEREKTGVNGVREAWSSSPNRLEWPESLVDIFGINKKERKGAVSSSDSDRKKKQKKSMKAKKKKKKKKS